MLELNSDPEDPPSNAAAGPGGHRGTPGEPALTVEAVLRGTEALDLAGLLSQAMADHVAATTNAANSSASAGDAGGMGGGATAEKDGVVASSSGGARGATPLVDLARPGSFGAPNNTVDVSGSAGFKADALPQFAAANGAAALSLDPGSMRALAERSVAARAGAAAGCAEEAACEARWADLADAVVLLIAASPGGARFCTGACPPPRLWPSTVRLFAADAFFVHARPPLLWLPTADVSWSRCPQARC